MLLITFLELGKAKKYYEKNQNGYNSMREIAIIAFFPRMKNRSKENVDKIIRERHKKIQTWPAEKHGQVCSTKRQKLRGLYINPILISWEKRKSVSYFTFIVVC